MEELNRYLSNLSEHHDMYVYLFYFSVMIGDATITCELLEREGRDYRADPLFYLGLESALDNTSMK